LIKRLHKQHEKFMKSFSEQVEALRQRFTPQQTEQALSNWKYYMESLDEKPYAKLTTKETAALLQNQVLANYLRTVDTAIYGRNSQVEESLLHLREHATKTFQQKIEKVAHG
jgi:5'-deoxynucleotidase YfbR-like HD superfamily hydrolase